LPMSLYFGFPSLRLRFPLFPFSFLSLAFFLPFGPHDVFPSLLLSFPFLFGLPSLFGFASPFGLPLSASLSLPLFDLRPLDSCLRHQVHGTAEFPDLISKDSR